MPLGRNWTKFGRARPDLGPNLARLLNIRPDSGQQWSKLAISPLIGQIRPNRVQVQPSLARFGPTLPTLVKDGHRLQNWLNPVEAGQFWPNTWPRRLQSATASFVSPRHADETSVRPNPYDEIPFRHLAQIVPGIGQHRQDLVEVAPDSAKLVVEIAPDLAEFAKQWPNSLDSWPNRSRDRARIGQSRQRLAAFAPALVAYAPVG